MLLPNSAPLHCFHTCQERFPVHEDSYRVSKSRGNLQQKINVCDVMIHMYTKYLPVYTLFGYSLHIQRANPENSWATGGRHVYNLTPWMVNDSCSLIGQKRFYRKFCTNQKSVQKIVTEKSFWACAWCDYVSCESHEMRLLFRCRSLLTLLINGMNWIVCRHVVLIRRNKIVA